MARSTKPITRSRCWEVINGPNSVLLSSGGPIFAGHRFTQRFHQLWVNAFLRIDPAGGGAILPGIVKAEGADAVNNLLNIGIIEDDYRRFAPSSICVRLMLGAV